MDKFTKFFSQLFILGAIVSVTTAVSLRHKRNVIAEYNWPEPDPAIDHFPHETTCHYYYLVLSEDDISVNKCPDGELFDYIDHKCASKENARCWSRHFGKMKHHHMKLKSRGHFRCPYAWGKYPDIKDCTRYYVCLSGKVKHKKCAPFEHFDKVSRKCVAEIEGVCADKTDMEDPDYKCPRTWGSFSFPEDCSKYYECLEKRPSLRTCPTDTLFHERKGKCLPHKHVHCGSRPNPYRKKEQRIASIRLENSQETLSKTTVSAKDKMPKSEHEVISESKISTPDPNSIIIERNPSIPDYSPPFENLSIVNKVTHPESISITSSKDIVTSSETNPKSENKVTSQSKLSTPDPNSIIIQTKSAILDNTQSETNQTSEELPSKGLLMKKESKDLPEKQSANNGSTVLQEQQMTNKEPTDLPVEQMTNKESTVLPVKQVTNKELTVLPVKQTTNKESPDSSVKKSVSNKEAKDLSGKSTVYSEESTILSVEQNFTNLAKNLPAKKIVPNVESKTLSSKKSISNETYSLVKISTETVLINDTDEVTDNDPEITDEFIEISTSETKSHSPLATQTIVVDSTKTPKKGTEEFKDAQTTAKPPQATPMEECSPKDPTCITSERGQVIRCPGEDGLFPYPKDERRFLICEKFNIRVKFCPGVTIFNALERKCVAHLIFV